MNPWNTAGSWPDPGGAHSFVPPALLSTGAAPLQSDELAGALLLLPAAFVTFHKVLPRQTPASSSAMEEAGESAGSLGARKKASSPPTWRPDPVSLWWYPGISTFRSSLGNSHMKPD